MTFTRYLKTPKSGCLSLHANSRVSARAYQNSLRVILTLVSVSGLMLAIR